MRISPLQTARYHRERVRVHPPNTECPQCTWSICMPVGQNDVGEGFTSRFGNEYPPSFHRYIQIDTRLPALIKYALDLERLSPSSNRRCAYDRSQSQSIDQTVQRVDGEDGSGELDL